MRRMPRGSWTTGVLMVALAGVVGLPGCAARGDVRVPSARQARADQLIADGCYACLIEARDILLQVARRGSGSDLRRAFETELLIALREKELAIDPGASLARAEQLATRLPAAAAAPALLRLARAVPADYTGTPRIDQRVARGEIPDLLAELRRLPAPVLSPLARAYLELALTCAAAGPPPAQHAAGPDAEASGTTAAAAPTILVYRRAICNGRVDAPALDTARKAVPRFVEIALFQGRAAFATILTSGSAAARAFLEEAYAAFPESAAATFHLATIHQTNGDCRAAMRFFDETIALRPRHEDARLGRVICRTYLAQPDAAIAEATALLDVQSINQGEALYWRAWNLRTRGDVVAARADADRARTLLYNSRMLTLAGMIEHDQDDLATAEQDLVQARTLDRTNCQAAWFLGLVRYKTQAWIATAEAFVGADTCYAAAIADTERRRADMERRTDVEPDFRARQLTGFDAALAEDRAQKSAAALNAALNYARAGDTANATRFVDVAAVDPARLEAVEQLRRALAARQSR